MSIPGYFQINFDTMLRAAREGQLALVEATGDRDGVGVPVYTVCMVNPPDAEHDDYELVPVARMLYSAEIESLTPPS